MGETATRPGRAQPLRAGAEGQRSPVPESCKVVRLLAVAVRGTEITTPRPMAHL